MALGGNVPLRSVVSPGVQSCYSTPTPTAACRTDVTNSSHPSGGSQRERGSSTYGVEGQNSGLVITWR